MTEREFTKTVLKYARDHGWLAAHFGNSVKIVKGSDGYKTIPDRDAQGFPDCVCVRDGKLVFAELKVGTNKPTISQRLWLYELGVAMRFAPNAVSAYLWTPDDMHEIMEVLT